MRHSESLRQSAIDRFIMLATHHGYTVEENVGCTDVSAYSDLSDNWRCVAYVQRDGNRYHATGYRNCITLYPADGGALHAELWYSRLPQD